jgi:hypothetical protein
METLQIKRKISSPRKSLKIPVSIAMSNLNNSSWETFSSKYSKFRLRQLESTIITIAIRRRTLIIPEYSTILLQLRRGLMRAFNTEERNCRTRMTSSRLRLLKRLLLYSVSR